MARGRKTGGRDFVPGQSGNPKGGNSLPPEIKDLSKLTPAYIKAIIAKIALMPRDKLLEYLQDNTVPQIELTVASILVKATQDGDAGKLNFLLDRAIGKVVEEKKIEIQPVKYITQVRADGELLQEVVAAAIEEDMS